VGVAVADLFTGMYATVAILAALRHADRTGMGQQVDMALLDTQVAMLANLGSNYLVSGQVPGRAGNAHQNIVPYQVFEVMPPEGAAPNTRDHLILAVGNDGQFAKFCAVAGCPELAQDPRYALNASRVRNRSELVPRLEAIMATRTKAVWLNALEAAKVPCGAINTLSEVFSDPQVQERGMVSTWLHPIQPEMKLVSSPIKMSLTPVRQDLPPPMLGQHTAEVLGKVLGWTAEQQVSLRGKGVI
jgi:crotonobetainyl-CoA:carnitine CoA-transferase CaiB-like acyl-CoA transferase